MASAELSKKRKRADDDAAAAKKSKSDKKDKKDKKEKKAKAAASAEDETAPATDEFIALDESKKDKKERKRKEKEARKAAAAAEEQEEAADVSAMDVDPPADGEKKKKKDKKSKKAKTEETAEEAAAPVEEGVKEEKKSKKDKKKEAKTKEEAKPETNGEEKSKKKDKKSKKTKEESAPAPTPAAEEQEEEPAEGGKREKYIVFVGNLPYTANKESIRAHFSAYNPSAVRCLNKDNDPNVCRGIAFLEFSNGSNMRTCLDKMHHTEFDDGLSPARRINLELSYALPSTPPPSSSTDPYANQGLSYSAGGGGKSKFRREKIKSRNVQLDENRVKRMQKEEEYKKQRVSEGGTNTQQDSIHPSRLALMHQ
ncbi:putative RNA-binding protein [Colletotrichum gloeosporioides]|uniref:Putative RNA-binding protein n=1 Tax=Colletotrichum gloeosporioides TaxID=474922 RepID=A0A8H4CE33_COLGL|nr:putative RNA-binding protein [Colletotrichum gloeosporioides]KAF3802240.1 putative RNA-binding protein [Colletotrichum gloeosporioides]